MEDFKITEANVGKVELYTDNDHSYIQARSRGNIYITTNYINQYVGVQPNEGYLYTGYDYDKNTINNYSATAYVGNGGSSVISSTVVKTIYHTVLLRQDINASNIEDGEKVFALEDDKTIFLHFKKFVPSSYNSEVILCQVLDENDSFTHEIVLTPGIGFRIKYNGTYGDMLQYDSTQPLDYLIGINKNNVSVKDENRNSGYGPLSDMPTNPKIKINAPTVSLSSDDWEIGRIAASDNGDLKAENVDYQVFYGAFYD